MDFKEFARRPDAYQKVCGLIAPSIFGHDDVKKAVACLLFGGARKVIIVFSTYRGLESIYLSGFVLDQKII